MKSQIHIIFVEEVMIVYKNPHYTLIEEIGSMEKVGRVIGKLFRMEWNSGKTNYSTCPIDLWIRGINVELSDS